MNEGGHVSTQIYISLYNSLYKLPGMKDISYQERLEILKLPTLVYRRTRGDMIETYKILHNKYYCDVANIIKLHKNCVSREGIRGHNLKLHDERPRLHLRKESFPIWITKIWNNLPENVVNAPSANCLKNRLDKHWQAERFLYDYTAAVPGQQRAEDRARGRDENLTTEAPRLQPGNT